MAETGVDTAEGDDAWVCEIGARPCLHRKVSKASGLYSTVGATATRKHDKNADMPFAQLGNSDILRFKFTFGTSPLLDCTFSKVD